MQTSKIIVTVIFLMVANALKAQQSIPYCDNFNSTTLWAATSLSGSAWQQGLPQFGATSSTHTPPSCFDVDLNSGYMSNSLCYLTSPYFNLTAPNSRMSFWLNYKTEANWDGTRMEYTLDSGNTWHVLGGYNDLMGSNWYNAMAIASSTLPAWHGISNGWQKSTFNLFAFNGQPSVAFRYVFTSDGIVNLDGFSVDNFCISSAPNIDLRTDSFSIPSTVTLGTIVPVNIKVVNYGLLPISNFNVYYSLNGLVQGPFVYNSTLQPGVATVIPCGSLNLASGLHTVKAFTAVPNDADLTNDTLTQQMMVVGNNAIGCDDFEAVSTWTNTTTTGTNVWMLGLPAYNVTSGAHSGTSAWDINLSTPVGTGSATLQSQSYTLTAGKAYQLSFWVNYSLLTGTNAATLLYSANGSAYQPLGIANDLLGTNWFTHNSTTAANLPGWSGVSNGWKKCTYKIPPAINGQLLLQLQFNAVQNDIGFSFDDFCITEIPANDAGTATIVKPEPITVAGVKLPVSAMIYNYGSNAITNVPVYYQLNGGASVGPFIALGTLMPGADTLITLDSVILSNGVNTFCVFTQYPNDTVNINDTICMNIKASVAVALPYFNNFDNTDTLWYASQVNAATMWQLGTPAFGATASAYTPPNSWDINLNSSYAGSANAILYSPYFNFANAIAPGIKFYCNYNTEQNWDGFRLDYRFADGPWQLLGNMGSPGSTNWYNTTNIISSNLPGWTGNSAGWKETILPDLSAFIGQPVVQFRFVFTSDIAVVVDGVSIDNFEITEPVNNSVANTDVNLGPIPVTAGVNKTVTTLVSNAGVLPLAHCRIHVLVNNVLVTDDSVHFNPPLLYGQSQAVSLPCSINAGSNTICTITKLPNGVADLVTIDDNKCVSHNVLQVINSYPDCRDFEGSSEPFLSINLSDNSYNNFWVKGKPNKQTLNTAYSGNNCLVTGITGNYPSNNDAGLYAASYHLVQGNCYKLSFMHNLKTEYLVDGGLIEYSHNGINWYSLGSVGSQTWYNTNALAAFGNPFKQGWSGTIANWTHAWHEFYPTTTSDYLFRFRFKSNQNINDEGWAIDDLCMEQIATPCVAGMPETINQIKLYPIPAHTILHLDFSVANSETLQVFDTKGNLVIEKNVSGNTHFINVTALPNGIYFLNLKSNGHWQKFAVLH